NITIREHFLTRIFVLANLRESLELQSVEKLFEFYSKNMFLFLCHAEKLTAELGVLFTNEDNFIIISKKFKNIVYEILSFPIQKSPMINTFDYMFNFVKSKLSESEKSHYQSLVDEFENNLITYSEISTLLYSWALRYNVQLILEQSLFHPFPKNLLLDLVESKKQYSVL
ncbi:YbgA family protein, partial [Nitrosopumilus sp.]|nr:YbgA family protein [Nitrosopumilus sp.]